MLEHAPTRIKQPPIATNERIRAAARVEQLFFPMVVQADQSLAETEMVVEITFDAGNKTPALAETFESWPLSQQAVFGRGRGVVEFEEMVQARQPEQSEEDDDRQRIPECL